MTTNLNQINREKYPIHFRLSELKNSMEAIGKFLLWYIEQGGELIDGLDVLIDQYFEIDSVAQQRELEAMARENAEALYSESDEINTSAEPKQTPIKVSMVIQCVGPLHLVQDAFSGIPADQIWIGANGNVVNQYCLRYEPPIEVRTLDAIYDVCKKASIVVLQETFI